MRMNENGREDYIQKQRQRGKETDKKRQEKLDGVEIAKQATEEAESN